jgi:hypothetical protein
VLIFYSFYIFIKIFILFVEILMYD